MIHFRVTKLSVVQRWLEKFLDPPQTQLNLVWKVTGVSFFYIVRYHMNALLWRSTRFLMPSEKNCLGWVWSQSCTVFFASLSTNQWPPRPPIRGPNRWKSKGARSRLYAGLLRGSIFSSWRFSLVWAQVWGQALLCKTRTPCNNVLHCFVWMAGLTSFSKYVRIPCTC